MTSVEEIVRRLEDLEKRAVAAEEMRLAAERERDEYRTLYLETMERCRKLELGLLSSKSERRPDDGSQLSLDVLSLVLNERQQAQLADALAEANAEQDVKGHTRRKPTGRIPPPEHLPRVEIQVLPPEVEKLGLDAFDRIGEDVAEVMSVDPLPSSLRALFARSSCAKIASAIPRPMSSSPRLPIFPSHADSPVPECLPRQS